MINLPFFGGTLVPNLDVLIPLNADGGGAASFPLDWPTGKPDCVTFYVHYWYSDVAGPLGAAASNAISVTQPAGY